MSGTFIYPLGTLFHKLYASKKKTIYPPVIKHGNSNSPLPSIDDFPIYSNTSYILLWRFAWHGLFSIATFGDTEGSALPGKKPFHLHSSTIAHRTFDSHCSESCLATTPDATRFIRWPR
jgi:hypothetical protein